mmetsp:Transcript_90422/g.165910  ORF Transcript_90422/g.165910 Transcript_90422/m.165910 type:complete len:932 (-) Transcript_90422:35-2830(-)
MDIELVKLQKSGDEGTSSADPLVASRENRRARSSSGSSSCGFCFVILLLFAVSTAALWYVFDDKELLKEQQRREALESAYDELNEKYQNLSIRAELLNVAVEKYRNLEEEHANLSKKELEEYRQLQKVTQKNLEQIAQLKRAEEGMEKEKSKPKLFDPGALGVIAFALLVTCVVRVGKRWLKLDDEAESDESPQADRATGRHSLDFASGDSVNETTQLSPLVRWLHEFLPSNSENNMQLLMDNLGAGIVVGTKYATGMVAFAALLYSAPELEEYLPLGIKANLWSCVVAQCSYCLIGGFPFGMALPQDIPCLLLGNMGAKLPGMVKPDSVLPTFMLLVSAQALLCSFLFYTSHVTGMTKLVMQLPASLLSGFIFANGLGLLRSAGKTLSRVNWKYLWPEPGAVGIGGCRGFNCLVDTWTLCHIAVGITNFVMILQVGPRVKSFMNRGQPSCLRKLLASLISPFAMVSCIPFFYLAMYFGFITFDTAHEHHWLPPAEKAPWDMAFWRFWLQFYDYRHWEVQAVVAFIPDMVSVAIISLLEASMGGCSVEASCPRDEPLDLGVELKAHALSNLVCGCTGGTTTFLQTGMTINACRTDGASHRIAGLVAAAICFAIFCLGVPIVTYTPRFMSGAVFIVVGYVMVKDSAIDTWGTMPLREYMGIIVCGIIYMLQNMETAMTWGLFYAMFVFLGQSVGHKVVQQIDSAASRPSSRSRPPEEEEILQRLRSRIKCVSFDGMVFWGSSRHIFDNIYPLLREPKTKFIIFDMVAVSKIDGSASKAVGRIVQLGHFQGVQFCFVIGSRKAQDDSKLIQVLQAGGLLLSSPRESWNPDDWPQEFSACPFFPSEDLAVQFCEDAVLSDRRKKQAAASRQSKDSQDEDAMQNIDPEEAVRIVPEVRRLSLQGNLRRTAPPGMLSLQGNLRRTGRMSSWGMRGD